MGKVEQEQPLYKRIKSDFVSSIRGGTLKPGDKVPTEKELIERYRVSRITVSRALTELKEEGVIVRRPSRGSFVAESAVSLVTEAYAPKTVKTLRSISMSEIACIIPHIGDMFSLNVIKGVLASFPKDKYIVSVLESESPERENYLLQRCLDQHYSGIILFPQDQAFFSPQLLGMKLQEYPLVLIDRYLPKLDTSYVVADHKTAGVLCLDHLADLGHERICFVTSSERDVFSVKRRIRGIQEAMERRGMLSSQLMILDDIHPTCQTKKELQKIREVLKQWRPTAFIASDSYMCLMLYALLKEEGLKVPDDVSLLTFDRALSDILPSNFFTHINQSEYLMGKEAGLLLQKRIEDGQMEICRRMIRPLLEPHRSTGPVKI